MSSYWKRRWQNLVLFGSHRELNYRIEFVSEGEGALLVRVDSGPGFDLELERGPDARGYRVVAPAAVPACWLDQDCCRRAIEQLLADHCSSITVSPASIMLRCDPAAGDLLPEGPQLNWLLSQVHLLWRHAPSVERRRLSRSDFIG